ncbi:sialic acid-binding Ig-like lectin 6 [Macrotis lagotis]|uniref:sialic acid-binding Ig-like lectin 6 n=1 Tax=Macrotis lagotis TaxID=92651 RepID=UPI003D68F567
METQLLGFTSFCECDSLPPASPTPYAWRQYMKGDVWESSQRACPGNQGCSWGHTQETSLGTNGIQALTQKPDIYVPQTLKVGHPGICSGGTPPIFSWKGVALSSQDPVHTTTSFPVIYLTPMLLDHGSNITCVATFPTVSVSTERTIQLNFSCEYW